LFVIDAPDPDDHIPWNMKVVLDTDVMVAALRSRLGASRAWLRAVLTGEATLLLSVPLALQYEAVLTRPEHLADSGATPEQIARLLDTLRALCKPVEISYLWRPVLRDADDEMVLETAVNGHADRLLTFNERDFLGATRFSIIVERPGPAWRAWRQA
jgi:putative PIN family toxin of toxin-antitoxin system